MTRLEEILKRCEAATKGPWVVIGEDDNGKGQFLVHSNTQQAGCNEEDSGHGTIGHTEAVFQITDASYGYASNYHENADFIAHARQDLPLVVQALQKAVGYIKYDTCTCDYQHQYTCEKCETVAEIEALVGDAKDAQRR